VTFVYCKEVFINLTFRYIEIIVVKDTPCQLIMEMYKSYKHSSIAVRIQLEILRRKRINRGVKQGYNVSPLLFITCIWSEN
jgi:hypothetical protein